MTEQAKPGPDRERPRAPAPPPPPAWRNWLLVAGLLVSILILFLPSMGEPTSTELSYSNFLSRVRNGDVNTAVIDANGAVTGTLSGGGNYETQIPTAIQDQRLAGEMEANDVEITAEATPGTTFLGVLFSFLPFLLLIGVYLYIGRRAQRQIAGGVGGILGSRAKVYDAEAPSTRFSDVAGEAGVPFFAITGSGFVELFVGVGASRVRDLFADAKKRAPAIIFIDEIDAIGQRRGAGFATNDEREQTLNQLLAEMDGFDRSTGIVVLAATNRPEILDPALLRPGRFDRNVEIPLPNQKERAAILAVHSRGKPIGDDVDLLAVARATPGFSGADLANLVNEAAIFAVRAGRERILMNDFSEARDRILLGRREASNALLPEEKRSVAVHEAGHAIVAALSKNADPVAKVTILPAGRALGVTEQLPENERRIYPERYLRDSLTIRLGGRSAEQLALGEISSGAANDLAGATQLAIRMIREFGMSPRLGPIRYSDDGPQYLGPQQISSRGYAEETQRIIDAEVERLLKEADERAAELLRSRRTALDEVVGLLLERETIDGEDVMAIAGGTASRPKTVVVPEEAPSRT